MNEWDRWRASGPIHAPRSGNMPPGAFDAPSTRHTDELASLQTGEPEAEISDLTEAENRFEEQAVQLLEVYQPVTTSGGSVLLFEAYFTYEGVAEAGRTVWLRFAPPPAGPADDHSSTGPHRAGGVSGRRRPSSRRTRPKPLAEPTVALPRPSVQ